MNSLNIKMKDRGFYSRVSAGPRAVINYCESKVVERAAQIIDGHRSSQSNFTFADFGSADGGTSQQLVDQLVHFLRITRGIHLPINVRYTDLPRADFNHLFTSLNEPSAFLKKYQDVFISATGVSFFEQIFEPQSVDLGFSSSAMHYLSCQPKPLTTHIHPNYASREEKAAFLEQAAKDWSVILQQRSRELKGGGHLVVALLVEDDHLFHLGNTYAESLWDNYYQLWTSLLDDKLITAEEFTKAQFQQIYRPAKEVIASFDGAEANNHGLVLNRFEIKLTKCPFREALEKNELSTDQFASEFVATHRSWTEFVFMNSLDKSRTQDAVSEILDELYNRYVSKVKLNPRAFGKDLVHLILEIERPA